MVAALIGVIALNNVIALIGVIALISWGKVRVYKAVICGASGVITSPLTNTS